ncbi:carboxylic ester hydrolase-14 [Coleophoma crateriformis]|uniref:Carboxylic ester hydrolase n=1 Tax=Coleophoma crateriformis TaxID=565419 RepID=A0A3D8S2S3_9HELO|nr:carboxylic ester hydrolase-14 [Coleophoma crateriformis]
MRAVSQLLALAAPAAALTITDLCTTSYAQSALPAPGFYSGIIIDSSSVVATLGTNYSISGNDFFPDAVINYCNVSFAYTHDGRDDTVNVAYWVPDPSKFSNRFLSTGGGGLGINGGANSVSGGVSLGAVSGLTDGGFGSFNGQDDTTFLLANGTVNWENAYMFGYQAIHEMTVLGKEFTKNLFSINNGTKLWSYYHGCSEGGREGWSQLQRFNEFDGASVGAPAFRYAFQQIQHLYSNVVEQTLNYYPPPCELEAILNATMTACDPLDGLTDGVVSRTDLCKLQFDIESVLGTPYYCAASSGGGGFPGKAKRQMGSGATPVQNGTVSAKAIEVAKTILDGLHDNQGRRVYFSYQPTATWSDAATQYNSATGQWELSISGLGAEFVTRYLDLQNVSTLSTLDGVTYDTMKGWIYGLWQQYEDSLQTTWPDLTHLQEGGAKVIHMHGESDFSIPTASSVRYWESVRQIMFPGLSYNESSAQLQDFYRLYLVPGGSHCSPNSNEANGGWPQTSVNQLIDWVENGIAPDTLNSTIFYGANTGDTKPICLWPLRPLWTGNGTAMECVYDQASIDTWHYDIDAFKMPVY